MEPSRYTHIIETGYSDGPELIHIERMHWPKENHWAIMHNGSCWNKKINRFVIQSLPSGRTEDFYNQCRFTKEEAITLLPDAIKEIEGWIEQMKQRNKVK